MKSPSLYKRMLRYLLPYWPIILLSVTLSLFIVLFEGLSIWFSASLIQTLFDSSKVMVLQKPDFSLAHLNDFLKYWTWQLIKRDEPLDSLKLVCIMMAVTFLLKNVLIYCKVLVMSLLNLNVVKDLRNELYHHAIQLPVSYFDRTKSGNIMSLIMNDTTSINASMTSTFDKLFIEPFRIISFFLLLFVINAHLTLAIFVIFPVLGVVITVIGKAVRRRSKRTLEHMAGLVSILQETVAGVRAVKMFNMHNVETEKFSKENEKFIHHAFRSVSIGAVSSPFTEVCGVVVVIVLLWYGGQQVLSNQGFSAEDFIRFLIILFSLFKPLKAVSSINNTLQNGFAAAERVFSILDASVEPLHSTSMASAVPVFNENIRFDEVTFAYPDTDKLVLDRLSFTIKKGSVVALVGSSGAGKSTVLDLLPRFYNVSSGAVLIDGKNTAECDLTGLRHLFGIVAQETILFNDTVYNNIAYGAPDASRDKVVNAAKASNALEFIDQLPQQFDTLIGERGVMLSGGQKQRLSIARALLRNPPVLILDEATSALDTESEMLVQSAINALIKNRTAIVVAHRLSTIRNADVICVIEAGRIVEQGTHDQLLALGRKYKYLHDIQFAHGNDASS